MRLSGQFGVMVAVLVSGCVRVAPSTGGHGDALDVTGDAQETEELIDTPTWRGDDGSGADTSEPGGDDTSSDRKSLVGHVVVLVADGARIDETLGDKVSSVTGGSTTDFWTVIREQLLPQGTLVLPGYNTGVTITAEAHAELLAGRRVPQALFPSDYGVGLYRPEVPTLFEEIRKQTGSDEDSVALIANTLHLWGHVYGLYPGLGESDGAYWQMVEDTGTDQPGGDTDVLKAVQQHLSNYDTKFALANFHQIDRAGHYGPTAGYPDTVELVDQPIVDFWNWLQSTEPYKDDTVLVVLADHGRHRWGQQDDWRNHGDQCAGCRQIPLFIAGPGIRKNAIIQSPYDLSDLGTTLAWMLGMDHPLANGQLMSEVFVKPPASGERSGDVHVSASGSIVATQRWKHDPASKSAIVVDDEELSSGGAIRAEAPVAYSDGTTDWLCWRELSFGEDLALDVVAYWPWRGVCRTRISGGSWQDMPDFPTNKVSPYFKPALAADSRGRLWLAYVDNQTGNWESRNQALRLIRQKNDTHWEGSAEGWTDVSFALDPSLVVDDDGHAWVAVATSNAQTSPEAKNAGRLTRHIEVFRVTWDESGSQVWRRVFRTRSSDDPQARQTGDSGASEGIQNPAQADPWARMEHPALLALDGSVYVGFVGYSDAGSTIVVSSTSNDGATWTEPVAVDDSNRVDGHLTPQWSSDGHLYWVRLSDLDTVEVCRWSRGESSPSCQDTDAVAADGLSATEGGVMVSLSDDTKTWTTQTFTW